jgi:hypothetical protein
MSAKHESYNKAIELFRLSIVRFGGAYFICGFSGSKQSIVCDDPLPNPINWNHHNATGSRGASNHLELIL